MHMSLDVFLYLPPSPIDKPEFILGRPEGVKNTFFVAYIYIYINLHL